MQVKEFQHVFVNSVSFIIMRVTKLDIGFENRHNEDGKYETEFINHLKNKFTFNNNN